MKNKGIFLLAVFMFVLLFSCSKTDTPNISNLNHNKLLILGHQGMGELYHYPGNSFISIETVINIGADGSEVDIQLTKDSIIVLFHNQFLESKTTGSGRIKNLLWNELSRVRYTNSNISICKLEDILSAFSVEHPSYFSLDCKRGADYDTDIEYEKRLLRAIKRLSEKYEMEKYLFVEGDLGFLELAENIGLQVRFMAQVNSLEDKISELKKRGIFGFGFGSNITKEEIQLAHDSSLYVMLWNIRNEISTKITLEKNPDIIQTDRPINTLMLFDRFDYSYRIP